LLGTLEIAGLKSSKVVCMANRSTLKAQLRSAWQQTIEQHYNRQLINSERGLQAFLCAALLDSFERGGVANNRRIFIEPTLFVGSSRTVRKPDIVICNSRSIIGVVELKFKPLGHPRMKKDLETLEWMAEHPQGIQVQNDRYLGKPMDDRSYPLVSDAVLCWAGVHRGMVEPVEQQISPRLKNYFVELHAVTRPDEDPVIGRHSL
jgi:hypothetical protein